MESGGAIRPALFFRTLTGFFFSDIDRGVLGNLL